MWSRGPAAPQRGRIGGPMMLLGGLSQNRVPGSVWYSSSFMIVWDDMGMAKGYRPVVRDQPFLLPPDMRDWLPPGHLAWFVIDAVGALDLRLFAVRKTAAGSLAGRAAYDPAVLLGLLVYGYACGVRSSRRIERACAEDVAFRVICAQDGPDHATIARFRRAHFADAGAMADLFGQVLVLAAGAGLGRLGLIAVDGTKIAASASAGANRTERRLRELAERILAEAEAVDAAEDELYGDARGDELPAELADPRTRKERIAAALAELEAERRAAGREREDRAAREREELAAREEQLAGRIAAQRAKIEDWDRREAQKKAATGTGQRERRPLPPGSHARIQRDLRRLERAKQRAAAEPEKAAGAGPAPSRNITDPHSRLMPVRGGGFIQGYNAQAVHSADGLCLGTAVTRDTTDYASFEPMMAQAQAASALLRAHARGPLHRLRAKIGTALADAGYRSRVNLTCPGPDRLIATGKRRDLERSARQPG